MIAARTPSVARQAFHCLQARAAPAGGCLEALIQATATLDSQGYAARPTWEDIANGVRPPKGVLAEAGEWQHGWQYFASSTTEHHYLTTSILPSLSAAARAHLRGHSGPGAGVALSTPPTAPEFVIDAACFSESSCSIGLGCRWLFQKSVVRDAARFSTRRVGTGRRAHSQGACVHGQCPLSAACKGYVVRRERLYNQTLIFVT